MARLITERNAMTFFFLFFFWRIEILWVDGNGSESTQAREDEPLLIRFKSVLGAAMG